MEDQDLVLLFLQNLEVSPNAQNIHTKHFLHDFTTHQRTDEY